MLKPMMIGVGVFYAGVGPCVVGEEMQEGVRDGVMASVAVVGTADEVTVTVAVSLSRPSWP